MVSPLPRIPDFVAYVVLAPSVTGSEAYVYVAETQLRDFLTWCAVEGHAPYVMYALSVYMKPAKAKDMVEMLKAGIPIK